MLEVVFALTLAAVITVGLVFGGQSVLSDSKTRTSYAVLTSLTVEIERLRATNAGVVPEEVAPLMRTVSGISAVTGESTEDTEVSAASDGAGLVALAQRDGDGCIFLVDDGSGLRFGRDEAALSCSAVAVLGAAASVIGTVEAPSALNLG
jgi:hypothetical protein